MRVLIIDGQGGGIGKMLVSALKAKPLKAEIIALGTNSIATSAMVKAGAQCGATGENAIIYNCRKADVIAGPLGIILTNALCGEISEKIAAAVSGSDASKVLIPTSRCNTYVAGCSDAPLGTLIEQAANNIAGIIEKQA